MLRVLNNRKVYSHINLPPLRRRFEPPVWQERVVCHIAKNLYSIRRLEVLEEFVKIL